MPLLQSFHPLKVPFSTTIVVVPPTLDVSGRNRTRHRPDVTRTRSTTPPPEMAVCRAPSREKDYINAIANLCIRLAASKFRARVQAIASSRFCLRNSAIASASESEQCALHLKNLFTGFFASPFARKSYLQKSPKNISLVVIQEECVLRHTTMNESVWAIDKIRMNKGNK